jgi:uncharacterized damage-inducible protein DinB
MKTHISRMLRAMTWADTQCLAALRDCPAAWAEALGAFAHVLSAEHVWLSRLQGRAPSRAVWPALSIAECEALLAENTAGYAAYIGQMAEPDLTAVVRYRNSQGEEFTNTALDILTQVVIHGAYHRGQIAKAIGRAGGRAVNTDYIIFARSVEPLESRLLQDGDGTKYSA